MKLCFKILAVAIIAVITYPLSSCSAPAGYSYQNVSISIATQCTDCPAGNTYNPAAPTVYMMAPGGGQGGDAEFSATVTNAPAANITWQLYPLPNLASVFTSQTGTTTPVGESGSQVGTFVAPSSNPTTATGPNVYYLSPGSVPVYGGAALEQTQSFQWYYNGQLQTGIPQGDVLLVATVQTDPNNPSVTVSQGQLVQVYNPANTSSPTVYLTPHSGLSPANQTQPVINVARGASYQFYGGTVGSAPCLPPTGATLCANGAASFTTDNASIWEVCPAPFALTTCITNGNATLGTITQTGLYTAPTTIPNPLPVVFVTSHFNPSISNQSNYAYVGVY